MAVNKDLVLENVRLIYRNFEGRKEKYNKEGDRNFGVVIPTDLADALVEEGWAVKCRPPREEGDPPLCFLSVSLRFDIFPPKIYFVTGRGKTALTEETCGMVDWAEIEKVDLILRPYNWAVDGEEGTKAYLKSAWITLEETVLDAKYADLPDAQRVGVPDGSAKASSGEE